MKTKKTSLFIQLNKRLLGIIVVVGSVFFVAQIVILSRVGTKSQEIEITRAELEDIRRENEKLTASIDKEKSVEGITSVISGQNFTEKRVIAITPDGPVAQN